MATTKNSGLSTDVVVVGAGIVGIACAYYLQLKRPGTRIALVDPLAPMSLTSAASGENYRSLWPREEIGSLTRRSIELMEDVVRASDNRINMTRRGYLYVARAESPQTRFDALLAQYPHQEAGAFRTFESASLADYVQSAGDFVDDEHLDGVDVLLGSDTVHEAFAHLDPAINIAIHARRAGDLSGQQLGQFFLEKLAGHSFQRVTARLVHAQQGSSGFTLTLDNQKTIDCEQVVNAAGPHTLEVGRLLGQELPLKCVAQQKISFPDKRKAVPRDAPFLIDLDPCRIDWDRETREALASSTATRWLTEEIQGGIHCRPDGGPGSDRIKLGWAFNQSETEPETSLPLIDAFPELVVRGASRANRALLPYIDRLPSGITHYGGYYTKTDENWPLIGPAGDAGAYVAGGLSGYGTMSACATGELIASWITGDTIEPSNRLLGLERYANSDLMRELNDPNASGEL